MEQVGLLDDNWWLTNGSNLEPFQYNHSFVPAISALALNLSGEENKYYYDFYNEDETTLLNRTPFDMVYFPKGENSKSVNQEHVWISLETAENIIDELYPENVILGDVNPDWKQGEVMATRSVRLTQGFHASASDQFHAHIEQPINILEEEFWTPSKQVHKKSETITSDITENKNITIFPNPTTGVFSLKLNSNTSKIEITDITGKIIYSDDNIVDEIVKIDISTKTQGIYIVKITTENEILTSKVIKQ